MDSWGLGSTLYIILPIRKLLPFLLLSLPPTDTCPTFVVSGHLFSPTHLVFLEINSTFAPAFGQLVKLFSGNWCTVNLFSPADLSVGLSYSLDFLRLRRDHAVVTPGKDHKKNSPVSKSSTHCETCQGGVGEVQYIDHLSGCFSSHLLRISSVPPPLIFRRAGPEEEHSK